MSGRPPDGGRDDFGVRSRSSSRGQELQSPQNAREPGGPTTMAKPNIVSADEWQQARDELLKAEKEATRALDALAARRRRLPMVKFDNSYIFATPAGPKTLAELFDGRDQLAMYQFMDVGPGKFCPGCTAFTNNVTDLDQLAKAGVTWVNVSNMPLQQIEDYKARMSW